MRSRLWLLVADVNVYPNVWFERSAALYIREDLEFNVYAFDMI